MTPDRQPGTAAMGPPSKIKADLFGLTRYQWSVLFAAWLGWGFDVFDGLLFNFVSPNAVPVLRHLSPKDPHTRQQVVYWTGIATSVLLVGWALGGLLFGRVADRIGRSRTLMLTMLVYALGTAACALAPNMPVLLLFRFIASLGIGGEWAAGASLVAEVVPERRRVEAGALLYTSASAGLFLAVFVNSLVSATLFKHDPEIAWRWVLASGLLPAAFAMSVRFFVKEPERWESTQRETRGRIRELFQPEYIRLTLSGFIPSLAVLVTWWTCNAFLQVIASNLAIAHGHSLGWDKLQINALTQDWITLGSNAFNLGGLIGTLATIPAAKFLGRKRMFALYWTLSAAALLAAFGHRWDPVTQLWMYFPIGLTVFGVFGSFTFYLPELFPTRLRATGAGFCYNIGRLITAAGPLLIANMALHSKDVLRTSLHTMYFVGFVPLVALLFLPLVIETRGRSLAD